MFSNRIVKSFIVGTILSLGALSFSAEYTVSPGSSIGEKVKLLKPGDKLYIKAGVYNESITISNLNGTKESPILIKGEEGVEIQPTGGRDGILVYDGVSSYITIEGLKITNAQRAGILTGQGSHHITIRNCILGNNGAWGFQSTLSDYITVENCELYGSKRQHGIYFATTDHPVARNNKCYDNISCGIHINGDVAEGGDGMITEALIENNIIYNNGRSGGAAINMDGVEKSIIRNNLIYNNNAGGITSFKDSGLHAGEGNKIYNNTVYFEPGKGRYGIQLFAGSKNAMVKNNIIGCGKGPALETDNDSLSGLNSDNNIFFHSKGGNAIEIDEKGTSLTDWQKTTSQDKNSLVIDPGFINSSTGDFHLKQGSPGIDVGITIEELKTDVEGKKRPLGKSYDIGAYEQ